MKVLGKIFHEETIGFSVIGMLVLACLYLYTESTLIQNIGLIYGLMVMILLCGFFIKIVTLATIGIYKYIKSVIG